MYLKVLAGVADGKSGIMVIGLVDHDRDGDGHGGQEEPEQHGEAALGAAATASLATATLPHHDLVLGHVHGAINSFFATWQEKIRSPPPPQRSRTGAGGTSSPKVAAVVHWLCS